MKPAGSRNLLFVAIAIVLTVAISIGLNHQSRAVTACGPGVTCPYIKTFGADVFAGGWFSPNCTGSYQNYLYPTSPPPTPDVNYGGILTYANTAGNSNNAKGGSSSQYGAFGLGSIEGNTSANYGFYSGGALGGNVSQLSFANTGLPNGSGAWGGQYEGSAGNQGHCIPDYYTSKQTNATVYPTGTSIDNLNSGNYTIDAGGGTYSLILGSGTIGVDKNVAIFVKGDVYIGGDITYAAHAASNVPKFALIAQGNIYVGPGVSQLSGWYIAQPASNGSPTTNDGVMWTCYDINTPSNSTSGSWIQANCANKLTLNGAVVAKHVNLDRTNGDLSSANTSEDTLSNALGSGNISEIINYTPDMVIGGPFFNGGSSYSLDSLVNLPPVFK